MWAAVLFLAHPPRTRPAWTYRGEPLNRLQFPEDGSEPPAERHREGRNTRETSPVNVQRIDGVRLGRASLHIEKSKTFEPAAND